MDRLSNPSASLTLCVHLWVHDLFALSAGECNPQSVDLYYLYGLSLLENAIASNSVLGKTEEQPVEEVKEPGVHYTWLDVFCV